LWAVKHRGAEYGQGEGLQGDSYALPTKDERIQTLPLFRIRNYADRFKRFARENPHLEFELTPVGCGLAGYKPVQIAPMFEDAPANVILPAEFVAALARPTQEPQHE
jgi:hypothetical protein